MDRQREDLPDRRTKRGDDVEVNAPFGWQVRFPARYLTTVIVGIAGFAAFGYMLRDHDLRMMDEFKSIHHAMAESSYILATCLNDKEQCARIQINMPDSMRAKLKPNREDR